MKKHKAIKLWCAGIAGVLLLMFPAAVYAAGEAQTRPAMYATFWSLVPPVVAIALALLTKEVYSSLFIGIVVGALFCSGFSFEGTVMQVFQGGFIRVLTDSSNMGILIFLVILGAMVCLMNRAGGSAAFGAWTREHIRTRTGAQLATVALGILVFIDDYFNCLTVGSVMRPVADGHRVSREKLAYLIDATAAPVCIIAPISSWAAAVSGFVEGEDGFSIFIQAIPYNFYALLTIAMMILMIAFKVEYGPMAAAERMAVRGESSTGGEAETAETPPGTKGTVVDLLIPILSLIVCCIAGMIYTGGFFEGVDFITAFSNSEASVGLAVGSMFALFITVAAYLLRRVLNFSDCMAAIPDGFKAMVPAILILTFAWTLKAMTDTLGAAEFVGTAMEASAEGLMNFLPAIIFLVGAGLAFATGTSWGTFGILIPIVVSVFSESSHEMMIISISACMAGAVCGDHCSPISDTTIMASAGAQCNHVRHVTTQLPYAMTAAAVSFAAYIVAGFVRTPLIALPAGLAMLAAALFGIRLFSKYRGKTGRGPKAAQKKS